MAKRSLSRTEIEGALRRLGELLAARGKRVELVAAGGVISVLQFGNRNSTYDIDAVFPDRHKRLLTELIDEVARERGLPRGDSPWLNDSVSFFGLQTRSDNVVFNHANLVIYSASWTELLGMKLSGGWRRDEDASDAVEILKRIGPTDKDRTLQEAIKFKNFTPHIPDQTVTSRFNQVWQRAFGEPRKP